MAASSFTFFASYFDAIEFLPDEQFGQMLKAICVYALRGEEPDFDNPTLNGFWTLIRPTLDRSVRRSEAGRIGGLNGAGVSRNQGNGNASKSIANSEQIGSKTKQDKDSIELGEGEGIGEGVEKESKGTKKKTASRFTPPTVEEVQAYCTERKNGIDAAHFVDFYTSRGWKYGNTAIKDWKACVRTWEKNNKPQAGRQTPPPEVRLGVGEFLDEKGERRYGSGNLPPVPMDAPPRPDNDSIWSRESNSWIPTGV